jgi:hypothetical protein
MMADGFDAPRGGVHMIPELVKRVLRFVHSESRYSIYTTNKRAIVSASEMSSKKSLRTTFELNEINFAVDRHESNHLPLLYALRIEGRVMMRNPTLRNNNKRRLSQVRSLLYHVPVSELSCEATSQQAQPTTLCQD